MRGAETDPLVVKVLDLLAENKVLEQRGSSWSGLQAGLVVHGTADIRGEDAAAVVDPELLMDILLLWRVGAGFERTRIGVRAGGQRRAEKAARLQQSPDTTHFLRRIWRCKNNY